MMIGNKTSVILHNMHIINKGITNYPNIYIHTHTHTHGERHTMHYFLICAILMKAKKLFFRHMLIGERIFIRGI